MKNPLNYRFPKRPDRREYESDEEWFEAEVKWWEERERWRVWVIVGVVVIAVVGGVVIALM